MLFKKIKFKILTNLLFSSVIYSLGRRQTDRQRERREGEREKRAKEKKKNERNRGSKCEKEREIVMKIFRERGDELKLESSFAL